MAGELHPQERGWLTQPQRVARNVAWIQDRLQGVPLGGLRHVIALKGCADAGKTSVLKCLIDELYRRDPQSWIGRMAFDPARVAVENGHGEYQGAFMYRGVRIAVNTRGDDKESIVGCFKCFAAYRVSIGVTAVRCHAVGSRPIDMEHVYAEFCSAYDFHCHEIAMPVGRRLRTRDAEMEVVQQIIARLDELVAALRTGDR